MRERNGGRIERRAKAGGRETKEIRDEGGKGAMEGQRKGGMQKGRYEERGRKKGRK